jgi:hypothetical protein
MSKGKSKAKLPEGTSKPPLNEKENANLLVTPWI